MALINCPECGKEISDKAKNCIHCGYPLDSADSESLPNVIENADENSDNTVHIDTSTENISQTPQTENEVLFSNRYKKPIIVLIVVSALLVIAVLSIIFISLMNPQKNSSEKQTENSITNGGFISNGNNKNPSNSAMEKEIETAKSKSAYNKSQYERQYKHYMNLERYTGTQASYTSAINNLASQQGQAYADCQNKINEIYSSNLITGNKEAYKQQYERERDRKIQELSAQMSDLKTAWENQQNYLKYYNLYLEEDEKLANEIKKIKDKYNN